MQKTPLRNAALVAIFAAALAAAQSSHAAIYYWDTTTTGLWGTGTNWSDNATSGGTTGVVPTNDILTDTVVFNQSSINGAETVQFGADASITGMTFANTGTTLLDSDSTTARLLSLGASGITINSGAGAVTLGNATNTLNLALGASQSWTNNSSNTFTVVNGVTSSATSGTQTLTVGGTGATTMSGVIGDGSTGGTLALTKSGAGTLTLSTTGNNTFSGGLTISAGTLSVASNTSLGGAGGTAGAITLDGGTLRTTGGFTNTHVITIGSNGGTINNTATANLNFNTANTLLGSGTLTITGNGSAPLAGTRAGVVPINAANTFSGNVIIQDGGLLEYGNASALGSGATVTLNNLGTLSAQNVAVANAVAVNDGGVLAFQNTGGGSFTGNITLSGSTTVRLQNWWSSAVQNGLISGKMTGTGSVAINSGTGTGATLTLSNATSDYTGATTISGAVVNVGTLANVNTASSLGKGSAGGSSADLVLSNGTLRYTGATAQSTDRLFSVGTSGGTLDASGSNNANPLSFTGTGAMGFNSQTGARTLTLTGTNTGNNSLALAIGDNSGATSVTKTGAGTWTLGGTNTYSGATTVSAGTLSFLNTGAKSSSSTVTAAAGAGIGLGVGGAGFYTSANVDSLFANTLTGFTMNATSLVGIDTTAGDFTYATSQSGTKGLVKLGANTLTLSGTQTYTGATQVQNGTLNVTGVLGSGGGTAVTTSGSGVLNVANTNGLTGTSSLTVGTGSTAILAAANNYSGATSVTGTLQLNNANAVQSSAVTISAANGLTFGSGIGTFNMGSLAGTVAEALTDTASAGVTLNVGSNNATTTYSGVLSGAGGITKNGTGTLNLNAVNTYSGATIVNAGTVSLASAGTPNSIASSDLTINSGATFTSAGSSSAGQNFTLAKSVTSNSGTFLFNNAFRGTTANVTNNLTLASGASLVAVNGGTNGGFGSQVIFGGLSRTAGATVLFRGKNMGGSTTVNANNTNQPQNIRFTAAPTTVGGGGTLATTTTSIIPYAIGDSGYSTTSGFYLTSGLGTDFVAYNPPSGSGAGTVLLTTYASTITSGASALNNVKITDTSATGIDAATTINSLILNSATAAAGSPGSSSVDGSGTLTINSGAMLVTTTSAGGSGGNYGGVFVNNATIGASGLTLAFGSNEAIVTVAGSSTLTMASTSGGVSGTAGLTKSGAGTLNLNAANTISGTVTINAGSIVLGHASALQNSTLNYNNQGGTLSFGALTSATLGGLSGAQSLALTNASSGNVALTVGNNNVTSSYAGALTGGGSLTKAGSGTVTLSGANLYTGGTTVNAGTLAYGNNFTMSGANQLTVAATGTAGTNYATVTSTSGTLTLGGTLAVNFSSSFLSGGESFSLFQASGGSLATGFTSVSVAGSYVINSMTNNSGVWTGSTSGLDFTFVESTGTLNVASSAIPEPSTYAILSGVAALVSAGFYRRRKAAV